LNCCSFFPDSKLLTSNIAGVLSYSTSQAPSLRLTRTVPSCGHGDRSYGWNEKSGRAARMAFAIRSDIPCSSLNTGRQNFAEFAFSSAPTAAL
jgi:hypothetical protein